MSSDFLLLVEQHMFLLLSIHLVVSILLSVFLSMLLSKRFAGNTCQNQAIDLVRLDEIKDENWLFRLFFKVSLYKYNLITSFLFMFILSFVIPVLGYIFAIWISFYLKNIVYEKQIKNTKFLELHEFKASFLKVERIFEESSMLDLMLNEYAPKSKKLKALSTMAKNLSPANLKIIRQTLSNTDDEIRMFGYSIINKAEKAINAKINHYLEIMGNLDAEDYEKIAEAANELAPLYWEMIYTELSHDSMKNLFLKEVKKYIDIAKCYYVDETQKLYKLVDKFEITLVELDKEIQNIKSKKRKERRKRRHLLKRKNEILEFLDLKKRKLIKYEEITTKLYILMGRVYMEEGKIDDANTEFTIAQELHGVESSFILPYLAEIHFLMGNYRVVSSIIQKSNDLGINHILNPVVEQWQHSIKS